MSMYSLKCNDSVQGMTTVVSKLRHPLIMMIKRMSLCGVTVFTCKLTAFLQSQSQFLMKLPGAQFLKVLGFDSHLSATRTLQHRQVLGKAHCDQTPNAYFCSKNTSVIYVRGDSTQTPNWRSHITEK